MRGMRNIVAHDYANVDLRIVWEVANRLCARDLHCLGEVFRSPELSGPAFARVSVGIQPQFLD